MSKFLSKMGFATVACAGLVLGASLAEAQTRNKTREAPPLTIQPRSFLDPGPIVPVGSTNRYMSAVTTLATPVYSNTGPADFGYNALPRRFDPPGRPQPIAEFSTGNGGR
jgi:hypothetical protein